MVLGTVHRRPREWALTKVIEGFSLFMPAGLHVIQLFTITCAGHFLDCRTSIDRLIVTD